MDKKDVLIIVALVFTAILISSVVYAALFWSSITNVNIGESVSFYVTDGAGSATLASPYTTPDITSGGTYVYSYRVYNDGNVDLSASITVTDNLPTGSTVTWDPGLTFTVTKAVYTTITLTITVPDDPATGSYTWTISASAA